jgi:antitoxin component YwqK of YwqJK toxin-antitoxin module
MKRFILLLVVHGVVGCNTKPSTGGSDSPDKEPVKDKNLLSESQAERILKEAVHVDDVGQLLKVAVDGAKFKDRGDLAYNANQPKPYSGLIKGTDKLGQLRFLGWVTAGKANGFTTNWHQNGQKNSEGTLKTGKKDGLWIYWSKNGEKVTEEIWKDGKQHGPVTTWFNNGQKMAEGHVTNGKLHGLATGWFENGQKRSEQLYENGQVVSVKMWNSKGEEIETDEESKK